MKPILLTAESGSDITPEIAQKYGVKWEFCRKADTGKRIIELLKENEVQHEQ